MKARRMSYIDPDLLSGALNNLITFVGDNGTTLSAKGVDSTTISDSLTDIKSDLASTKTIRDNAKTALAVAQQNFAASAASNYTAFSNAIDTVSGAMGKLTPAGKQVLGYRKHVTGADNHHASPQPASTETPAK